MLSCPVKDCDQIDNDHERVEMRDKRPREIH